MPDDFFFRRPMRLKLSGSPSKLYTEDRPTVDFTWECEWRLEKEQLPFDPACARTVVPDRDWEARLLAAHDAEQDWRVLDYSQIMDASLAEQLRDPYPWTLTSLRG